MLVVHVLIIITLTRAVTCTCTYTSWLHSFDNTGQSKCKEADFYIQGFDRHYVNYKDDPINHLEGVQCCSAPPTWSSSELLVNYADWTTTLDSNNAWAHCPTGYFLQGLYRSNTGYLYSIENARCSKPVEHPLQYGACYQADLTYSFDKKGISGCREGYYVTGLYRSNCHYLYCLDALRCCQMANKKVEIDDISKLKSQIMDTTFRKMVHLAHLLGYGWCGGCKGIFIGENFYKTGYTWAADSNPFWGSSCEGVKSNERLQLAFGDWSFGVKEIKYGASVVDNLQLETIDSGTTFNNEATPVTESFERSETVQDTITHSTTTSWKNSHELGITLNFNVLIFGASISYKTSFEYSSSTTNTQSKMTSKTFKRTTSKTLQPYTAAKYNIIIGKSRTTIPYTAVIIAKFSTEFRGFLRSGQGFNNPTTNYHYQHRGSKSRPTFNYRFGDRSTPFYAALKRQSDTNAKPWLWNELLRNFAYARGVIDRLTDEKQYEFTLSGKLEQVAGTRMDIIWETVNLNRSETLSDIWNSASRTRRDSLESPQIKNGTMFATVGPNDKPAVVVYPEISLASDKQLNLPLEPMDTNSS